MAKIDKVFIGTSELLPFTIMDLLLTLAEQFVFTWVWTDELLDEWNASSLKPNTARQNRRRRLPMRYVPTSNPG